MKISVHPLLGTISPWLAEPTVSNVRMEVVPTAITRLPFFFVSAMTSAVSFEI